MAGITQHLVYAGVMPELPDVTVYIEALTAHVAGRRLDRVRLSSPFVLRSVDPPLETLSGATVQHVSRVGKRIVLGFGAPDDVRRKRFYVHCDIGQFRHHPSVDQMLRAAGRGPGPCV